MITLYSFKFVFIDDFYEFNLTIYYVHTKVQAVTSTVNF